MERESLPIVPPRRVRRYREIVDPVERRRAIVTLFLDGWSAKAIAGCLKTSRPTVSDVLRRWMEEGWPGLADRSRTPRRPARRLAPYRTRRRRDENDGQATTFVGVPAVAVPTGLREGLPMGVQVISRLLRDDHCLDAASAIEARLGALTPSDPVR